MQGSNPKIDKRHCWYHLFVPVAAALFLGSPPAQAQERDDYQEWREKQRDEYRKYLSEQDAAFRQHLKDWERVRLDGAIGPSLRNKPVRVPRADNTGSETDGKGVSQSRSSSNPGSDIGSGENSPTEGPSAEKPPKETSPEERGELPTASTSSASQSNSDVESSEGGLNRQASLTFFSASLQVPYSPSLVPSLEASPNQESIRTYWTKLAGGPYEAMLDRIQKQRQRLELSDWGYYMYLRELAGRLYGTPSERANEPTLWTWFMLIQSGYTARIGYQNGEGILLLPVEGKIFNRPQVKLDGRRYYAMTKDISGGALHTYEDQHAKASRSLILNGRTPPNLAGMEETRRVSFSFRDERYQFDVAYNPATVDYLRAFPNVGLGVLFSAGVSKKAQASLTGSLSSVVDSLAPRAALDFLLTFAQFSTDYKRDQDHFGEERYLFPEETLATDYSDCEDRAVLLSYLVRKILDREVVGLRWPNHVALAVETGNGLEISDEDRTIDVDGEKYVFADPTYIGSSVGMEMPLVEGKSPEKIQPLPNTD